MLLPDDCQRGPRVSDESGSSGTLRQVSCEFVHMSYRARGGIETKTRRSLNKGLHDNSVL